MIGDMARVRELFDQIVELPPSQRAAQIAAACGDNVELSAMLWTLLRADDAQSIENVDRFIPRVALEEIKPALEAGQIVGR